jgi:hypothetical protein
MKIGDQNKKIFAFLTYVGYGLRKYIPRYLSDISGTYKNPRWLRYKLVELCHILPLTTV